MSVPGNWVLHYDWGCSGNYISAPITFNNNGTFAVQGLSGKWSSHDGQILFQFDSNHATYGGSVVDSAMVGISSTFAGLDGCWYAIKQTATTKAIADHKPKYDPSGSTVK
jgi:hypothetical protein